MLSAILSALAGAVLRLVAGRWFGGRQVSEETYAAKEAEAKELARPDTGWTDTADKL